MKIGLHTRLRAHAAARYDKLHRHVPDEIATAIRAAGVTEWHIFRDGDDLFHCIEVGDYDAAMAALADLPANRDWQHTVAPLMDVAHDYSGAANDRMTLIWDLQW